MAGLQGRTFGGYELANQLGSGGIAEVYRTQPSRGGGRAMAVKIIYPEFAQQPGFKARFDHIVQAASRLNHPHILPLVASGEQNGYLYLVFPFVEGGTFREWLASGKRLGAHDVAPFFRQVGEAASYAHSQGVIHGNIKPSNIYLHEGRHILLGDFGRLWDIGQMDMTHAGPGVEAVAYMAPEATEKAGDQRSDIYSLGAVLFAGLTGRPPFTGATPFEIMSQHTRQPVPRLASLAPSLGPGVARLDDVTERALAKAPEQRYPSALALAQAIEVRVRAEPAAPEVVSGPMSPPTPPRRGSDGLVPGASGPGFPPLGALGALGAMNGPAGGLGSGGIGSGGIGSSGIGFAPLSSALQVDPNMEQGRVDAVAAQHANAGAVAQLPTTAMPIQPAAPGLASPRVPPGAADLPTQLIPLPSGPAAPGAQIARGGPAAGRAPMPAPMPAAPNWTPFVPAPAGSASAPPPAPAAWSPASPPPPSQPSTPGPGSRPNGGADDWFGIDVEGVPTPLTPSVQPPLSPGSNGSNGWASDGRPFSATQLGLPRLSTPELGGMPPSWRDLVSGSLTPDSSGSPYPSAPSDAERGSSHGSTPSRWGESSASDSWTSETGYPSASNQWVSEPGHWTGSGEWVSESRSARRAAHRPDYDRRDSDSRRSIPRRGASRWDDSQTGSRPYTTPSEAYSAYGPAATDEHAWDPSRSYGAVTGHHRYSDDSTGYGDGYTSEDESPRRGGRGRAALAERGGRQSPHPYDAFDDDGYESDSYGASSAYMPLPAPRTGQGRRPPTPTARQRPPARRLGPIVFCLVLLLLGSASAVVAFRPDLCPQQRCATAHNFLMRELGKFGIGGGASAAAAPLSAAPGTVTLQTAVGATATATITVANTAKSAAAWTATSQLAWLTISPASGTMPAGANGKITLTAKPGAAIAPKTYTTAVLFTVGSLSLSVPVTITVTAPK